MKTFKNNLFALLSAVKILCLKSRTLILGSIFALNFMSIGSSFTLIFPPEKDKGLQPDQEVSSATQPTVNPAVGMGNIVVGGVVNSLTGWGHSKGVQFKEPQVSSGFNYRSTDDKTSNGFAGDEFGGDVALDADVYDGLILGALYQYTKRNAENPQVTSERLESHGFSIYTAKRFLNLINAGLTYNHVASEHRLTGTTLANLDRDSNGFTAFVGASDRHGKWSWATTPSFTFVHDDYEQQSSLQTGLFSWSNNFGYDLTKQLTLGAAFTYNHLVLQDTFNNTAIRDDAYWTIGPRFRYYATKNLTAHLDFDSQMDYNDYEAYTVRLGADYAF